MISSKADDQLRRYRTGASLASLTVANAFIFQAELSLVNDRVRPLRPLLERPDPVKALTGHWKFICDHINYVPIFNLAREVLLQLPERAEIRESLRELGARVFRIVAERAALRHDLMGRIYHRLLVEAKYLGTFYTSVPAATLLLKLALDSKRWPIDWSNPEAIGGFQVADLACGTGTLLMAAQQAITDNFIRARNTRFIPVSESDLRVLHKVIIENAVHGYDVLSSAVHLTASTLALLAPEIVFRRMQLHCVPFGEQQNGELRLGSIEFLRKDALSTQLDLMGVMAPATTISGASTIQSIAPLPDLDLCVMNPPFTRSVGGNLLFGSLPENQRKRMQAELKVLLGTNEEFKKGNVMANSTAGLGSVFVAVGSGHIKPGGRIALVLPAAVGSGVAWEKTRQLFRKDYVCEFLAVSHDPNRWNFSENTDLSEMLVVARKRRWSEKLNSGEETICVNLWSNVGTPIDAIALASEVLAVKPADVESASACSAVAPLNVGGQKRGEIVRVKWATIANVSWYPLAFAQTDLNRVSHFLRHNDLYLPMRGVVKHLELVPLQNIASLGPDRRDIYDGFTMTRSKTSFPAFWSHQSDHVTTIHGQPNMYLSPRTVAMGGRRLRRADLLWPRAGRIMMAERMRFNTQRLAAVMLPQPALSNVWWPLRLEAEDERLEFALMLWLNSTLGMIVLCSHRVPTQGPWVQFKKPLLKALPVLDIHKLNEWQLRALGDAYADLAHETVQPLPAMASDAVRIRIDEVISKVLELPNLNGLRDLLSREPVISGVCLSPFSGVVASAA